jgi:AraC-like DNA-binding protein
LGYGCGAESHLAFVKSEDIGSSICQGNGWDICHQQIMSTNIGYRGAYGSFRTILAGPGHSFPEALVNVERVPGVSEVTRHRWRDLTGARIPLRPEEGSGHWDVLRIGNDVFVASGDPADLGKRVELACGEGLVQFHFKLPTELSVDGARTPQERFVAITVRTRYLAEHFLNAVVRGPGEIHAILYPEPDIIRYGDAPLSPGMLERIGRLIDNPYSGTLALVHNEAVTLEVLCAAVVGLGELVGRLGERYSTLQLRRLQVARHLLLTQRSPVPTIREVARAAGMNETALKRGFRAVFGETLFDFSVRHRMRQAFELLREGSMPVSRVADAVGYRHQTSFASAFRRYFGVSPRDARPAKSG